MSLRQFRLGLLVAGLGLLPLLGLLQASAQQPSHPKATLMLCRVDVSPCQREINLAPGEETTLALFVSRPASSFSRPEPTLVAWHVSLALEGSDVVAFPDAEASGTPFRERAALANLNPLNAGNAAGPSSDRYFRIRNTYSPQGRRLEYAVTLVGTQTGDEGRPHLGLREGDPALLGTLKLRGDGIGTARLGTFASATMPSKVVVRHSSGELTEVEVETQDLLARINVGPDAERVRLEGRVWTDVPDGRGAFYPFTRPLRVEVWKQGVTPAQAGGAGRPLATFTNLQPDTNGFFAIRDLPRELIPYGVYDLRVAGQGALTYVDRNVTIGTAAQQIPDTTQVVTVDLGPLPGGDLNGDNVVNDLDLSALAARFGQTTREAGPGLPADFNGDGVVDGQDFSLAATNYGMRGE